MLVRKLEECPEFVAGDSTRLREILRPDPAGLALRYSLAHARLPGGEASDRHRLSSSEVYFIMEGSGIMQIDEERRAVGPGDTIYIPPHAVQHIENNGTTDLIFICIVDPAWREEDEEVL